MKNRKLLIPVRCTTRKFYLQPPPPGRNEWHVRFIPPSVDRERSSVVLEPREADRVLELESVIYEFAVGLIL